MLKGKTTLELSGESDPVLPESEGESDCLADRAQALDEQKVTFLYSILTRFSKMRI